MVRPGYEKYAEAVQEAAAIDPMPTVHGLSKYSGISPEEIVHYILVQWATSYSEAHLAIGPLALRQLKDALDAEDFARVKGIVSWLHSEL